jgi:hypothetical protein
LYTFVITLYYKHLTNTKQMKKVLSLVLIAGAMSIVACGPNAEEKAKQEAEEKAKMDSLFNAASQSMTEATDSTAAAAPEATTPAEEPAHTEEHHH